MISVIITNYNYSRFLPRAIRSALDQTVPVEILVVDDASTDTSKIIIDSFGSLIRSVPHPTNQGLAAARNTGWQAASGDRVVFLDADDMLHRDFCRICEVHLSYSNADAVATDYFITDEWDRHIKRMGWDTEPIACGVVYRTEHLHKLKGYRDVYREDIEFMDRFMTKYTMDVVREPLYRYRKHGENMTLKGVI